MTGTVGICGSYLYSLSSQAREKSVRMGTVNQTATDNAGKDRHNDTSQTPIVIGYQTGVDPSKVAQADKQYEQVSHRTIDWRKFDTGADVVAGVSSGDVAIGNIGSSPLAAATSKQVPLQVFLVAGVLGDAEALVVRNASHINTPQDLVGKKIAVPFVSTTHYSLLAALKHWGINPNQVEIVNLRPPEITAAWERGDIDAAYIWEPVLGKAKQSGHVLVSSKQVAQWGSPTYDVWVTRKDFAKNNPDFLKQFTQVTLASTGKYRQDPSAFVKNNDYLQKIAKITGSSPADITLLLPGSDYPNAEKQRQLLGKPLVDDITKTAQFLQAQGKIDSVLPDYSAYVTSEYITSPNNE